MAWLGMELRVSLGNKIKEDSMHISTVRRRLYSLGYQLFKDRGRNWSLHHQGGYMILNYYINGVVAGADYDLSLDDVIEWLEWLSE